MEYLNRDASLNKNQVNIDRKFLDIDIIFILKKENFEISFIPCLKGNILNEFSFILVVLGIIIFRPTNESSFLLLKFDIN